MSQRVFICHSSTDRDIANAACATLEARGIECWIAPRNILAGNEYGDSIVEALSDCRMVVFIFSSQALASPQVRREIERAVSKEKTIVPVRIEDVMPTGAMEFALSNTHWLNATARPIDPALAELAETVAQLILKPSRPSGSGSAVPASLKSAASSRSALTRRGFLWTAASVAAAGTGVLVDRSLHRRAAPGAVRVAIQLLDGADATDPTQRLGSPVIAPDGSAIVVPLVTAEGTHLFHRPLDSSQMTRLDGTDHAVFPFWSPDSQHLGFFADGKLKRIPAAGGSPIVLCDLLNPSRGGSWGSNGVILFSCNFFPLYKVAEGGGTATAVTKLDTSAGENNHRFPVFLPDGNRFLYYARTDNLDKRGIYLDALDQKKPRQRVTVADGQFALGLAPQSGDYYLVTQQAEKIVAQTFDMSRGTLTGSSRILLTRAGDISASDTGALVVGAIDAPRCPLIWFDRSGKQLGTVDKPDDYYEIALSPDGRFVAASRHDSLSGAQRIWIAPIPGGSLEPLSDSVHAETIVWSQDSSTLFYSDSLQQKLLRRSINPRGAEETAMPLAEKRLLIRDISPDGRFALAQRNKDAKQADLAWSAFGENNWHVIATSGFGFNPAFSPDGKWIAYCSDRTGKLEVYMTDFPAARIQQRISNNGGAGPKWRGDGRELFYLENNAQMMAVAMTLGDKVSAGTPKLLFRVLLRPYTDGPTYAVTSDGQRFLVTGATIPPTNSSMELVLNWPSLLPA